MPGGIGKRTPRSSRPDAPPGARHPRRSRSAAPTSPGSHWSTRRLWVFLDRAFHENLVEQAPSEALARFLQGVDVVVESGSLGDLPPTAFERILDACAGARPPWFIYCPRPDVDWTPLEALWSARGYRTESLGAEPIRYRKALAAQERADMFRVTRALGIRDEDVMRDGYLLVDMTLARPEADAGNPPIARLRGSYD